MLYDLGVAKVFGPGTNIQEAAIEIIKSYDILTILVKNEFKTFFKNI